MDKCQTASLECCTIVSTFIHDSASLARLHRKRFTNMSLARNYGVETEYSIDTHLDVKDDTSFIALTCMFDSGLVPGYSLDTTAQIVTLHIVGFPNSAAPHASLTDAVDREFFAEEVLAIEQHNQFVEPGDQQRDFIMACNSDLSTDLCANLLG